MKSKLFLFALLVLSGCTVLETYKGDPNQKEDVLSKTNPIKNSGIRYYREDITQANAPDTTYGSEVAVLVDSSQLAIWDRSQEVFVPVGGITKSKSDPSGAPPTGQPWAHINTSTGMLRRWDGSAWINGVAVTVSKLSTVADTSTLTPTIGDEFVLTTKDTSGVYSTDRWLLRIGGSGAGGVSDGDKGDITVSGTGTIWTIDNDAVTAAKIATNAVGSSELANTSVTPGSYTNPNITIDSDGRVTLATSGSAGSGSGVSTLDTTFTSNYTASTDSIVNLLTSITESNDIVVTLPAPSVVTVKNSYRINQIDRNDDGLGFTLVQVDGIDYDFYFAGDTVQFISFTPDLDQTYEFRTVYLDGSYRWIATSLKGASFSLDSLQQILSRNFNVGDEVTIKARTGGEGFKYRVEAAAISGYATDTINVVPTLNSNFAIIQPVSGKINVGWFCSGDDIIDDTEYFRAVGDYLRYSNASTLFVPKGNWCINEDLNNYSPVINIHGNLIGESRDSSIIRVDSITGLKSNQSVIFYLVGDNKKLSGLGFDVIGDPTYSSTNALTVINVNGSRSKINDNHFMKMTLGTSNTAGHSYVASSSIQTANREVYTVVDTIFPGDDVGVVLSSVDGLVRNGSIIFLDAATGNSDTTYINNRYYEDDSINVHRITDTIPSGAIAKTMTYGVEELTVQNNIFENIYYGTACKLVAQGVTVTGNKFRNNGDIGNRHDLYNQSGLQTITNNWFEGGGGYAIADANKQDYRISGGRVITGNTFFNKPLGIQLTASTNPVTWYATAIPAPIFGNRIMAEGEIISNNVFYNTPGTGLSVSLEVGEAFGGVDPNSPLKGNGSVIYSNNTHIGHVEFSAASEFLDMQFTGNVFEMNDTSLVDNVDIVFPDSANIKKNTFTSRVEANYVFTGTEANVINNEFYFSKLTSTQYIKFIRPNFERNRVSVDSFKNSFNIVNDLIFINGGMVKGNTFTVKNNYGKKIGGYAAGQLAIPDFIDNTFNGFCGIELEGYHNNDAIKNAIFENNEGMLIWSDAYGAAPNAVAQTRNSGRVSNYLSKTLLSGKAGHLIKTGADSTFISATYLDKPNGTLITPPRSDSTLLLIDATVGRTIRAFVTNKTHKNDILVIDTTYAGKLKSQGQDVVSNALFVARSLEDVTEWSSIAAYSVGDVVTLSQKCYRAIRANTNQNPSSSGDWQTYAIEIDVLRNGGVDQSLISGITNPKGGVNDIQSSLDSLNNQKAENVTIADAESVFDSTTVEGALEELDEMSRNKFFYIAGTNTLPLAKGNSAIILDGTTGPFTVTLTVTNLRAGDEVKVFCNGGSVTLDSSSGGFIRPSVGTNESTIPIDAEGYVLVWDGTNFYKVN